MPDALEQLAQETIEELLQTLPVKKRLTGVSPVDLVAALSPEMRAALQQLLREEGASAPPPAPEPERGGDS